MLSQETKVEANEHIHDMLIAESFLYYDQCGEVLNLVEAPFENTEISLQYALVLQIIKIGSNHEAKNMQRQSNIKIGPVKKVFIEVFSHGFYDSMVAYMVIFVSSNCVSLLHYGYRFQLYSQSYFIISLSILISQDWTQVSHSKQLFYWLYWTYHIT